MAVLRAGLLAAAALLPAAAQARVLVSQKDALALAFPDGRYERRTAFLTEAQKTAAERAARSKVESAVWTYYEGKEGTAYFESHPVRTMDETFMVAVDTAGAVRFVEILAFSEPDEFVASPRWLKQFPGRALDDELALRRGLRNIAGATLTSDAVTRGVRRVLAVHQALHPK